VKTMEQAYQLCRVAPSSGNQLARKLGGCQLSQMNLVT